MKRNVTFLAMVLYLGACGKSSEPKLDPVPAPPPALMADVTPAPAAKSDKAGVATIRGTVKIVGKAPRVRPPGIDPQCAAKHAKRPANRTLVVDKENRVKWAFVHVTSGLDGKTFPIPKAEPILDQKGCFYEPHVVGVMVGQKLAIRNSDDVLHNVHGLGFANDEFNVAQTPGAVNRRRFKAVEVPFRIKCDVHPWMGAWVGVVDHPFHAVTDDKGAFEIKGLPPGTYKIEVWHERYVSVAAEVKVAAGDAKTVNFGLKEGK